MLRQKAASNPAAGVRQRVLGCAAAPMTREIDEALDRLRAYAARSAHLFASGARERAETMLRLAQGEQRLIRAMGQRGGVE